MLGSISWYLFSENTNHNCPTFILRFDNIHIWFQFNLDIVLHTIDIGMEVSRSVLKSLILSASTISSLPCCDTSSLSFLFYLFTTFRSLSILTGADLFSKDISFRSVVWKIGRILFYHCEKLWSQNNVAKYFFHFASQIEKQFYKYISGFAIFDRVYCSGRDMIVSHLISTEWKLIF